MTGSAWLGRAEPVLYQAWLWAGPYLGGRDGLGWDGVGLETGWGRTEKGRAWVGMDGDEGRFELRRGVGVGVQRGGLLAAAVSGRTDSGSGLLIKGGVGHCGCSCRLY